MRPGPFWALSNFHNYPKCSPKRCESLPPELLRISKAGSPPQRRGISSAGAGGPMKEVWVNRKAFCGLRQTYTSKSQSKQTCWSTRLKALTTPSKHGISASPTRSFDDLSPPCSKKTLTLQKYPVSTDSFRQRLSFPPTIYRIYTDTYIYNYCTTTNLVI